MSVLQLGIDLLCDWSSKCRTNIRRLGVKSFHWLRHTHAEHPWIWKSIKGILTCIAVILGLYLAWLAVQLGIKQICNGDVSPYIRSILQLCLIVGYNYSTFLDQIESGAAVPRITGRSLRFLVTLPRLSLRFDTG